ncbi:MAG: glycosyl transferase [Alphaproteobacteria bacterium]|nr:glycosyl transferase [Alphaproteobacteria bacterium]
MPEKVLFYVQHLLGIGHVVRSSRIARALERAGFAVTIAYGGVPLAGAGWGGADVVQLPAVSAGPEGFGSLVSAGGEPVSEKFKDQRKDRLLALLSSLQPDILLVEAYPFARRIMRFELLPLLQAAKNSTPRPLIVSSIRDILQEGRKPKRIAETRELVEQFFDAVLVHGEEGFAPLALSFPEAGLIADKLHYTGWVGPEPGEPQVDEQFDVIVSAGGGAVGAALFEAALSVRAGSAFADGRWLVLTGPNLAEDAFQSLSRKLPSFVTLERFRADLPALLRTAKVSVSQSGYNTVADVLSAGCRAVVVPYAEDGETEQLRRAETLAAQDRAVVVHQADLSEQALAAALGEALSLPQPEPSGLMNGAAATASLLRDLCNAADG